MNRPFPLLLHSVLRLAGTVAVFAPLASAAASLTFTPSATQVAPGGTFTVTIALVRDGADAPLVAYDVQATASADNVFSITGQSTSGVINTPYTTGGAYAVAANSGVPADLGAYSSNLAGVSTAGTLRTFTFTVAGNAPTGTHNLSFGFAGAGPTLALYNSATPDTLPAGTSMAAPVSLQINVGGTTTPTASLVSAVSRKTHGTAGTFDLVLPVSGTSGIESRWGGANNSHKLVFTFDRPVNTAPVSVLAGTATLSGSPVINGSTVEVNLAQVADAQSVTLRFANVTAAAGATFTGDFKFRTLLGDTDGNGSVTGTTNAADHNGVRTTLGYPATSTRIREDVDASGTVNSVDLIFVQRSNTKTVAP